MVLGMNRIADCMGHIRQARFMLYDFQHFGIAHTNCPV